LMSSDTLVSTCELQEAVTMVDTETCTGFLLEDIMTTNDADWLEDKVDMLDEKVDIINVDRQLAFVDAQSKFGVADVNGC